MAPITKILILKEQFNLAAHCYNLHVSDKQCDIWASAGECDKNPLWMANNCQQSCQRCLPDCIDAYGSTECQHWAKMGECLKNHKWMLQNCALSCGICDSGWLIFWFKFNILRILLNNEKKITITEGKWNNDSWNNHLQQYMEDFGLAFTIKKTKWHLSGLMEWQWLIQPGQTDNPMIWGK